ncbi:MAG: hypothetical protein COV57_00680 [Candidatus Liptonbacteria bacterium CG11_big_fil_rev_8_21_14_0_20_35_14]|uniref:NTP pyrophosphohydrolase MazG putative catalytic core domain-containing protein n=1 Tax=Candidatus Liptonbacteria bacterium CG11_big_fil_rev_8_21_14_0_20_35_14 TaxID=1974634 RepID=A0A2H0NAM1_9BACT|nr:MAG: hypothetical protein COV57_00680 [Candidatus Liptonbacteria bacterium CG11_big_fil_rev_8_21_14_0_20_35_14]
MDIKTKKFTEVIKEAQVIARNFANLDPKPWPPEVKTLDLQAKVGNLSQLILNRQGFKKNQNHSSEISEELATIFFIVLDLADTYDVDFSTVFDKLISDLKSEISSH